VLWRPRRRRQRQGAALGNRPARGCHAGDNAGQLTAGIFLPEPRLDTVPALVLTKGAKGWPFVRSGAPSDAAAARPAGCCGHGDDEGSSTRCCGSLPCDGDLARDEGIRQLKPGSRTRPQRVELSPNAALRILGIAASPIPSIFETPLILNRQPVLSDTPFRRRRSASQHIRRRCIRPGSEEATSGTIGPNCTSDRVQGGFQVLWRTRQSCRARQRQLRGQPGGVHRAHGPVRQREVHAAEPRSRARSPNFRKHRFRRD
jgi:hypothetical protein